MRFRAIKSLPLRPAPRLRRPDRKVLLAVEAVEARVSLSGLVKNPAMVHSFNPQPDPPSRHAAIIAI
jgi:hypothetical protein